MSGLSIRSLGGNTSSSPPTSALLAILTLHDFKSPEFCSGLFDWLEDVEALEVALFARDFRISFVLR